jgi:glutamyl-tRNA synthetase
MWFREAGYLPAALLNFLQLLAYPPVHSDTEIQSFGEFAATFDWSKVNTVGPVFDVTKLDWLNGHYIRSTADDKLADLILEYLTDTGQWDVDPDPEWVRKLRESVPIIKERITTLRDAWPMIDFLFVPDDQVVINDDARATLPENAAEVLDHAIPALDQLPDFHHDAIQQILREKLVADMGIKAKIAFGPLRVAISGRRVSPPLFESMEIIGKQASLTRIKALRDTL